MIFELGVVLQQNDLCCYIVDAKDFKPINYKIIGIYTNLFKC